MKNSMDELRETLRLLKIEWKEDLESFKRKAARVSLGDKRKEGLCWYPVQVVDSKIGMGERLVVTIERTSHLELAHSFQSGKTISFFTNSSGNDDSSSVNAVVNYVRRDKMVFTLNGDDLPEWIDDGKLGVEVLFDESSYREMERAMDRAMKLPEGRIKDLREILLGYKTPTFEELEGKMKAPVYNESQLDAMQNALAAKDVAIIHGPPGTGKTTTLVGAIEFTLKMQSQVLVCAPGNAAVDLLAEKLDEKGVRLVRIGHPARVTDKALSLTLDAQTANHDSFSDLRHVRRKSEEMREMARKYKRRYGFREREQRKMLFSESKQLREEAEMLEHYIVKDILNRSRVILTTLVGAAHSYLRGREFECVFIDEASQALEPASWIPILKAKKVVFAGDHHQLPPTIKSLDAAKQGLSETLFEKVIDRSKVDKLLTVQYRMHEKIMAFSSREFYENALEAHESVAGHLIDHKQAPIEFVDTAGCGFAEAVDPETLSTFNAEEGALLFKTSHRVNRESGL